MDKVRVSEIAKELGVSSKDVIQKGSEIDLTLKAATSTMTTEKAEILANYILTGEKPEVKEVKKPAAKTKAPAKPKSETKKTTTKTTPKKEPKVAPKPKEVEKKEAIKKEEPKKEESVAPKKESLAQASLKKRRGLVIVKKKHPQKTQETKRTISSTQGDLKLDPSIKSTPNIPSSLEAMFSSGNEIKKKKKTKKSQPTSKKSNTEKLDLLGNREFTDDIYNPEDEMVVLPDLTMKLKPEAPRPPMKKKDNNPSAYKAKRPNMFQNNDGIGRRSRKKRKKTHDKTSETHITSVEIPDEIRVYEFAEKIGKQSSEIIAKLFMLGVMVTKNDFLDKDAIEILGDEFNVEVTTVNVQEEFDYVKAYDEEVDTEKLQTRAPVITIMGHVDHGKTSLLDFIRNSRVADGESGGITQHVGAYMVEKNDRNITFIDTPGHEAFTHMRARGAQITDIVVVVVAADDGVKPQTKEAIDHAKVAGVPMIIAVNKIDKPTANPDMVKTQLSEIGILPTDWGGEHEFVHVSAKSGEGIEDLLELILLQADVLELKADPTRDAKATVVESSLEKGRGPVATVIVENGTLRVGNTIVAGIAHGKIRALLDDKGNNLEAIKPGEPGVIVGLSEVPDAGETVVKVKSDKEAREYAKKRYDYLRQRELSKSTKVTLDELSEKIAEGEIKSLPVVIKADTQGSLEAIKGSLDKLKNEETKVDIIHSGIGGVSESDVSLANASENCIVLGFNIRPTGSVREKAKKSNVTIKTYKVIYDLIDDVKALLSGMMSPIVREEHLGQAKVREVFNIPKIGTIAGCMVTSGVINRGAKVRLIREGVIVYESSISSLKRFKDDAKEVAKGFECGIGIENFDDIKVDDYIESFTEVEEKVTL